jgi:S1-C subfamily serine protease
MNESLSHALPGQIGQTSDHKPRLPLGPVAGIVLLSAAIGAAFGAGSAALLDNGNSTTTPVASAPAASAPTTSTASTASLADLYDSLRPSIVEITAASSRTGAGGTGSGIILDTQGNIVTNYHVVNGANNLDVKLSDGSSISATVVGTDPGDDLAVIHIDPQGATLRPVTLADSTAVRIGDRVVAIGNPLGLEATLTDGVVSGLGRVLSDGNGRPLRELIQTDTAINPGNSGGGLFNLNGELVGITNALENPSGADSFSGIGYAIPVSTLKAYLPAMLTGQTISHAKLGISLRDLSPAISQELGLSVDSGVLIGSVEPGSAAAKAGLRGQDTYNPGDVIVGIDGTTVTSFDDLASVLDTKQPGDQVSLQVVRGNDHMTVTLKLDAWTS